MIGLVFFNFFWGCDTCFSFYSHWYSQVQNRDNVHFTVSIQVQTSQSVTFKADFFCIMIVAVDSSSSNYLQ